ncbi:MAG TPA: peptidoglycan-binding domain-containing protein, partial [Kofleriaceae bacterium]|nr:peptidoglycan-binding domain-containing protein [Kofleriaceae bacterium]
MTREHRGSGSTGGAGEHGAGSAGGTPGKRTLVDGLQGGAPAPSGDAIQRKDSKEGLDFGDAGAEAAPVKSDSARFEGDKELAKILAGAKTLNKGDTGVQVTKLQQALVDMGYPNPVNGTFDATTETALKKFQKDAPVVETGVLDKPTLEALHKKYDTRKPYLDNAKFDPATPGKGVRALSADDKTAALAAMVPDRGPGGKFVDDTGDGHKYADEIEAKLKTLIASLHKRLFEDKAPLRADPAKNFEKWAVLEAAAKESKHAVDAVYGSYKLGPEMKNPGNFIDQWDDEVTRNAALGPAEKTAKAREKVDYLIVSNCADVNKKHTAVPSGVEERVVLKPVIDKLVATPGDVQKLLELDIGWEGAQLEGQVFLQRYKEGTDAANRERLWKLFQVCIHEYIHALENDDYHKYANTFRAAGDQTRYNTLVEGMCDFFTDNVRATVAITPAMQKNVEGPYHDATKPAPAVKVGSYPSRA